MLHIAVKYKTTHPAAVVPSQGAGDVHNIGYDLKAISLLSVIGSTYKFSTGIAVELPPGYFAQVHERSSFRIKYPGWVGMNGIIDNNFRGTICVVVSKVDPDADDLPIGFTGFQLIAYPEVYMHFERSSELSVTARGDNGFGSTSA